MGNALFVGIKVGRTTLAKVMPYMLLYYAAIILGLLLVTYIPAVSMVLPRSPGWSEFFFQATFPIFFSKKGGILCTGGCRLLAFSLTF